MALRRLLFEARSTITSNEGFNIALPSGVLYTTQSDGIVDLPVQDILAICDGVTYTSSIARIDVAGCRTCLRIASSQIAMAFCSTSMCHPIARASACAPVPSIALVYIVTAVRLLLEICLPQHSPHDGPEAFCSQTAMAFL